MKQIFKLSTIVLVLICITAPLTEAQTKSNRRSYTSSTSTINTDWLKGRWIYYTGGGSYIKVSFISDTRLVEYIYLPSSGEMSFSRTYKIYGNEIVTSGKSHYLIDWTGKRLLTMERAPYTRINNNGEISNSSSTLKKQKEVAEEARKAAEKLRQMASNNQNPEGLTGFALKAYERAKNGDAEAQCALAGCYHDGDGVTMNREKAAYWYRKAAEQGDAFGQVSLGWYYENGYGVSQDYSQAVYWYRKAAEQGNTLAQSSLGYCYEYGKGVSKDYSQAVYWYRKAADQGSGDAQFSLGSCYEFGHGVSKDLNQAAFWYRKAAEQGVDGAKERLRIIGNY